MRHRVPLSFSPRLDVASPYGGLLDAWSFSAKRCEDWFEEFTRTAEAAIGQKYLPVYRMADGEFMFLLGRRHQLPITQSWKFLIKQSQAVLKSYLARAGIDRFRGHSELMTSWGESYARGECRALRAKYIDDIKLIHRAGFIAPFFFDSGNRMCATLMRPAYRELCAAGVALREHNYVPFHFPLYLLSGPAWTKFIKNRRILVVTSVTDEKRSALTSRFRKLGAASVEFYGISATRSMLDVINCDKIVESPDLVLVAAGIGASRILAQLSPLKTLAIDIGGLMNCFANPDMVYHGFIRSPVAA